MEGVSFVRPLVFPSRLHQTCLSEPSTGFCASSVLATARAAGWRDRVAEMTVVARGTGWCAWEQQAEQDPVTLMQDIWQRCENGMGEISGDMEGPAVGALALCHCWVVVQWGWWGH